MVKGKKKNKRCFTSVFPDDDIPVWPRVCLWPWHRSLQKYQCFQITCKLQRHYCPRVKPKSGTSPPALENLYHSDTVQFIKVGRGRGGEKLSSSSHGPHQKNIFPTMAAADGSLGRSSEDQRDAAAAAVAEGPLRTLKLEILGLHWIITYISLPTSI